jgi:poly(A) polymerase
MSADEPTNNPELPAHEPVSLDDPSKPEKEASRKLLAFLKDRDCFETDEHAALRVQVLADLKGVTQTFIEQVCDRHSLEKVVDGQPVQCGIFPFGSYLLGVCSQTSDIDVLCVCPRFVKKPHFFQMLYELLLHDPRVSALTKIESAYVPIMTMCFGGIDIDISFAAVDLPTIPDDLDLSDDSLLEPLDVKAVASVNGVRTNLLMLKLVPSLDNFRNLLRVIRLWSKAKAVYGNVYGYLGGVNCALLCVFACQRYPTASLAGLVLNLFKELAEWPWPEPIYINRPNLGSKPSWDPKSSHLDAQDVMPIITPAYPAINSLRSANRSTRQRMSQEFKHAYETTLKIIQKAKKWPALIAPSSFFQRYKTFVQIKVWADTAENFRLWFGTFESRIRKLAANLDSIDHMALAVTYPCAFETPGYEGKAFCGSFFIALEFEKTQPGEKWRIDISPKTKEFIEEMWKLKENHVTWLVEALVVARKDLPLFVFPGGVRPEAKPPHVKKPTDKT